MRTPTALTSPSASHSSSLRLQSALTGVPDKRRFEIRRSRSAAGETHETSRKSRRPLIVALWPFSESVPPKGSVERCSSSTGLRRNSMPFAAGDFVPWGERLPRGGGRYGI